MSRVASIRPPVPGASLMVAWRLDGRRVLVVGGGAVAASRALAALEAGAEVTVVSPRLNAELQLRRARKELTWVAREYEPGDLHGVAMVLSAVDDNLVSRFVARTARARSIPVSCADEPELCDFWFPSTHREGAVQIAISTGGNGPALAQRLKDWIAAALPDALAEATERFGRFRQTLRGLDPAPPGDTRRMHFVGTIGRHWPWRAIAQLDDRAIDALVDHYLEGGEAPDPPSSDNPSPPGQAWLVGAGPGDPALLTDAAKQALERADLVLADRLIAPEILEIVKGELRIARKFPGRADEAQAELDQWVIDAVRAGRQVVRLKAGDPCVFGRGGEEVETLRAQGIDVTVIPGITSALSAPLSAGISLTMRGVADRIHILTGHGAEGAAVSMPQFEPHTSYVWLMSVGRLEAVVQGMLDRGAPESWPAALVERATRPGQRAVRAPLAHLPDLVADRGLAAPAVLVISPTVARAEGAAFEADLLAETRADLPGLDNPVLLRFGRSF